MPTFLDAAGAPAPANIDGLSFLPTLKGRSRAQPRHDFLYWESHGPAGAQAVRFGPWKAVRTNVHQPGAEPRLELFNLQDDPSESRDVAAAHPAIVTRAAAYLATRQLAIIPEWNYYPPAIKERP